MRAYVDVRMRRETLVREFVAHSAGRSATFVRPWYVVGPVERPPVGERIVAVPEIREA